MGESLNEKLYKGPDLTNSLVGVLTRFRKDRVAVMADIESMLYQVPDRDSSFLRFFCWEDGNLERELQECQMVVHLFGAISSPACANFAYNKEDFPSDVISTLKRNFYVDDCLKSLTLKTKATAHVDSLRNLLSRGGFRLTKWVSNSREVLEAIPKVERSKEVRKLGARKDEPHVQRALGVQ